MQMIFETVDQLRFSDEFNTLVRRIFPNRTINRQERLFLYPFQLTIIPIIEEKYPFVIVEEQEKDHLIRDGLFLFLISTNLFIQLKIDLYSTIIARFKLRQPKSSTV